MTNAESPLNGDDDILAGDMPGLVSAPLEEHRAWGLALSAGVASQSSDQHRVLESPREGAACDSDVGAAPHF